MGKGKRRGSGRWLIAAWLVWVVSACGPAAAPGPPVEGVVAQVVDGDTVVLAGGEKVRLLGIDAPEMEKEGRGAEFLAHEAKEELKRLVAGKRVRLAYDKLHYDQYGRLLAYVYQAGGGMVNEEMLRRGLARVYLSPPNVQEREALVAAQRQAMAGRWGVWRRELKQDEAYYVVNWASYRFHRPSCPLGQKMSAAHRLRVESLWEAYFEGYSPCRSCRPHEAPGKNQGGLINNSQKKLFNRAALVVTGGWGR